MQASARRWPLLFLDFGCNFSLARCYDTWAVAIVVVMAARFTYPTQGPALTGLRRCPWPDLENRISFALPEVYGASQHFRLNVTGSLGSLSDLTFKSSIRSSTANFELYA